MTKAAHANLVGAVVCSGECWYDVGWSDVIDLTCSTVSTAATVPVSLCTLPDGKGEPLSQSYSLGPAGPVSVVDATITSYLLLCQPPPGAPTPVAFYPAEDIWLGTSLRGLRICPLGTIADGATDIIGRTTFSRAMSAGGQTSSLLGEWTNVYVNGEPLTWQQLMIQFNSPDINGDLRIDLTDTVLYAGDWLSGAYAYRSDLCPDLQLNLSDTVLCTCGRGTSCP